MITRHMHPDVVGCEEIKGGHRRSAGIYPPRSVLHPLLPHITQGAAEGQRTAARPQPSAHRPSSRPIEPMPRLCASRHVPESIMLEAIGVAPLLAQNAQRAARTSSRGRGTSPRLEGLEEIDRRDCLRWACNLHCGAPFVGRAGQIGARNPRADRFSAACANSSARAMASCFPSDSP
jgi:hypothetical protein